MHILLVDDDADNRRTIGTALRQRGHSVREVADGLLALLYLDDEVDLLVTDVEMPGLDGMSLLRTLRERFGELPVIVMSGQGPATCAPLLRERATAYLAKPVDLGEFLSLVRQCAGDRGEGDR
ncbi:MAG: response regulator [Candidatus Latescibacterota bacterium]